MLALRLRFLTKDGAVAAAIVGSMVFAGTGFRGSITLLSYFLTSSLLGRLRRASFSQQRGSQRDAVQVLANGGIPALLAVAQLQYSSSHVPVLSIAYSSAVAAAAADTWATEIGGRFGNSPRSIVTGHHVKPGTSGGITAEGLVGACVGAALVALTALPNFAKNHQGTPKLTSVLGIAAGGLAGSIADSLFGATLQEERLCERCSTVTEHHIHDCGNRSSRVRGVAGWDNDVTNLLGIICGTIVGLAVASLLNASVSRIEWSDSTSIESFSPS